MNLNNTVKIIQTTMIVIVVTTLVAGILVKKNEKEKLSLLKELHPSHQLALPCTDKEQINHFKSIGAW